jgi:hypothetical protein
LSVVLQTRLAPSAPGRRSVDPRRAILERFRRALERDNVVLAEVTV